jgi:prenyltransferase beta subunit
LAVKRLLLAGLCLVLVPWTVSAQSPSQKKETIAYLHSLYVAGQGFRSSPQARPSVGATSSALRALAYFGGKPPEDEGCARLVKSCFDRSSGGFADQPGGKIDVHTTSVGIMAIVQLKLPTEPYEAGVLRYLGENAHTFEDIRIAAAAVEALGKKPSQARAWVRQLEQMRLADGSYGKGDGAARATGGAVAAVLRLGGKVEDRENVLRILNAGQRSDGGFGKSGSDRSELESTYRIVRCFAMLHSKPQRADALRAFLARCRNRDGGYGVAPSQPSSASGTYFAAIVLHWLEGECEGGRGDLGRARRFAGGRGDLREGEAICGRARLRPSPERPRRCGARPEPRPPGHQ